MPDLASAGLTPMEQALRALAQALRGDAPAATSVAGRDIDLSPAAPAPTAPAASWPAQRPFLAQPARATGTLPQGSAPGLFEQAVLASRGALGLGGDEAGDYSTPQGQDAATRAGGVGELLGLVAPMLGAVVATGKKFRVPAALRVDDPLMVYHGTPHEWTGGRFKLGKVGSGEGAAAYGHGAYVADVPDTARSYRSAGVVGRQQAPEARIAGTPLEDYYDMVDRRAAQTPIDQAAPDYDKLTVLEGLIQHGDTLGVRQHADQFSPEALKWFEEQVAPFFSRKGRLYELNLHANPDEHLLNWDVPFHQQPPAVQEALARAGVQDPSTLPRVWEPHQVTQADIDAGSFPQTANPGDWTIVRRAGDGSIDVHSGQRYMGKASAIENADLRNKAGVYAPKGEDIYHALARSVPLEERTAAERKLPTWEAFVSNRLTEQGLLGHRYLDQLSRGNVLPVELRDAIQAAGGNIEQGVDTYLQTHISPARSPEQYAEWRKAWIADATKPKSYNYVIYDPRVLEIAKTYGVALPVAAALYEQQQQHAQQ